MTATERALELTRIAAKAADEKQGDDLVGLDVSGNLPLTDVFLLVTGRNERMVLSIAEEIEDQLLEKARQKAIRREGRQEGRWVLLDFGDLVVHIFTRKTACTTALSGCGAMLPSLISGSARRLPRFRR